MPTCPDGGFGLGSGRVTITHRQIACAFVGGIVIASLFLVSGGARAHSGDSVDAEWASVVPAIDGAMGPGEWADAAAVDLGAILGNLVPATMLVKNDGTYLWFAYDATGDLVNDFDAASFALDTGHDGLATDGREDQFLVYLNFTSNFTEHLVYSASGTWMNHDSPFNPSLPNHAGLAGAGGFGPSDLEAADHRIYEFQIPLALLGAAAGDTLGLFGGSQAGPGVYDYSRGHSTWPDYVTGPIPLGLYGDLNLGLPPGPVGVSINPSSTSDLGAPGNRVFYTLRVRNTGTAGGDTFDLTSLSVWSVTLWDASGVNPLVDMDGDTVPDTGNLTSGGSVNIIVGVDIPPTASGCDVATITATSSVDTNVSDTSLLTTCTGPASFAPPHADFGVDVDGDTLFDYLEVDAVVTVVTTGYYYVVGSLYSGDGSVFLETIYRGFFAGPGPVATPLSYLGLRIYASGLDGPYRVELELRDDFGGLLDTDVHTTSGYRATDFDPPPAQFSPPHADLGVDTDVPPNGGYDLFLLRASLQVDRTGYYYIGTQVFDSQGSSVTYGGSNYTWLAAGIRVVEIAHQGIDFYRASADGPYRIEMSLYDDFGFFMDNDTHVTGPYARTDFDAPPISFAPPHSDHGEDVDVPPDGLYDSLVVSASVDIGETGDFRVIGQLYGPGGWPPIDSDEVTVPLTPGPAVVDLGFSGPAIRRAALSGNFDVQLYAQKVDEFNFTDYDRYTTGFYGFTEFQPPPAMFAAPHGDRATDASVPPDGYYDYLVIDASVDVTRAGRFTVEAYVTDYYGRFFANTRGSADLDVGAGSIPLRIDGHLLWQLNPYMPLYAYMTLFDTSDNQLDFGTHVTGTYDPRDFQPPDGDEPSSVARVTGGYRRSAAPIRVDFDATDPSPSDGIASVALHYRYSPNNGTWFPWTVFGSQAGSVGQRQLSGTFWFDPPNGDGYYEFYTAAADYEGNTEPTPAVGDGSFAAFIPARIEIVPAAPSFAAGATVDVMVRVVTASGQGVALEAPMTVSLLATSAAGRFQDVAGNPITSVVVPSGAGETSVAYADTRAGSSLLLASVSGLATGTAAVSIVPALASAVDVAPQTAALVVADSMTFTATVRDAFGNEVLTAPIAWSVQGSIGTIMSSGVFSAGTAVVTGTVTVESGGVVASATVTLLPGPLDRVEAFPAGADILVGWEVTAHVRGVDQYGNVVPGLTYQWSVEGPGRLSATTGDAVIVTATAAGTIIVTITAQAKTATVTLVATAVTPPDSTDSSAAVGVGGTAIGLAAGIAIGWMISRRRGKRESGELPPKGSP